MRLGSSLGMITTAEGVETEEQFEILKAEGCMQVQGYLFSRPKPAAEIPSLVGQLRPRVRAAWLAALPLRQESVAGGASQVPAPLCVRDNLRGTSTH